MTTGSNGTIAGLPKRIAVAYILLFAAALAFYFVLWRNTPAGDGDTPQYFEVAKDLSDFNLDSLHDRTIGYPLLLRATGATVHATQLLLAVSLLLHLASVWLLAVVLRAAGLGPRALLAFGFVLILPPYVEPAAWVQTENLAQFTLVAGFAGLVLGLVQSRIVLLAASALAFGYGALTRPVYQALPVALAGLLLVLPVLARELKLSFRGAARAAVVLTAGSAILLGGMSYVNYVKFGYFGVVPSIGFHLCTKTMSFVERLPDEYAPVREIFVNARNAELVKPKSVHSGSQTIWNVRSELSAATGLATPELSRYLLRMNLLLIRKAPIEYLQEVARSMAVYWFPPATPLASMHSSALRWLWAALHAAVIGFFFLQLVVLAGVGTFEASRRMAGAAGREVAPWKGANVVQSSAYLLAGSIVIYTMLITCAIDIGDPRQRRPTDVLVVFLCFLGACVWRRSLVSGRKASA